MIDPWTVSVAAGAFGLMIGSFLNVCTLRWPQDESVVFPGSHCPSCGADIRWYDNMPVLSYVFLRGRCRACKERISLQYPLVELATGLVWAGVVHLWRTLWGSVPRGGLPDHSLRDLPE